MEWFFWILVVILFYSFFGYFLVIGLLASLAGRSAVKKVENPSEWPEITLFIPAYNELDFIPEKIKNSLELDYPADKLHILFLTDGSDDGSTDYLLGRKEVRVLHEPQRRGKIAAMNRGIRFVKTEIVVFSDCNTYLGKNSLKHIAEMFRDPTTGCVSGEKRIFDQNLEGASGSGEGLYWKYESLIKKKEAAFSSTIGAAGELFAIRTALYLPVEPDTILDDFIISMRIAMAGYRIDYNPDAYAIEFASANVQEELKRKVRIASGTMQAIGRLADLLRIGRYGWISFQYWSHKVLRWTITPLALLLLLPANAWLAVQSDTLFYKWSMAVQLILYGFALLGYLLRNKELPYKFIFAPYYFFVMHYAQIRGIFRYWMKNQSVNWEKSKRSPGNFKN